MNRVRTVRRTHSFSLHLREQINEPLSPPTDFPCNFISPSQFPAKSGLKNNERETYSCAEMSQLSSPSFRRKHRSLDRRVGRKIRSNWQVFNKENYQSFSLVTNVMNGASKHELTRTRDTCTCHRHKYEKERNKKKKRERVASNAVNDRNCSISTCIFTFLRIVDVTRCRPFRASFARNRRWIMFALTG